MTCAMSVDISIVMNAHREGLLLLPSIQSAKQSIANAERHGLRCELIVVLDKPDELTLQMAQHASTGLKAVTQLHQELGDLGECRNAGVREARGDYVAFLDGDDLWCETWLSDAFAFSELDGRLLVLHPELNFFFGHNPYVFAHVDMEDPQFHLSALALANVWTSLCMTRRSLLLQCPYPHTDMANHIGYEDWGWNMRAMAQGAIHKIVPGTSHAIRNKAVSLVRQTTASNCFPAYPPGLFCPSVVG